MSTSYIKICQVLKKLPLFFCVSFCMVMQSAFAQNMTPDTSDFVRDFTLANEYYLGRDREQDYAQAFALYAKVVEFEPGTNRSRLMLALEQKSVAFERLAHMFNQGLGTRQNKPQALKLYKRSLILFQQVQMYTGVSVSNIGSIQQIKKDIFELEQALNLKQAASGQRYEFDLNRLTRLAEAGNLEAQNELGDYYYGTNQKFVDMAEAIKWYQKAAARNHTSALFSLGYIHELGKGVSVNTSKGESYFLRLGSKKQMPEIILAHLYETGRGREKNLDYALELYKKLPASIAAGDVIRVERKITMGTAVIDDAVDYSMQEQVIQEQVRPAPVIDYTSNQQTEPRFTVSNLKKLPYIVTALLIAWFLFAKIRQHKSANGNAKIKDQTVSAARILIDVGDFDQAREMLLAHLHEHPADDSARILLQQAVNVH